jgi:hypothetical protein
MGDSTLRRVRRLTAVAAPLIAELERRRNEWRRLVPEQARNHLLAIVAVFRYGEPRIDEPLVEAYNRAVSKLNNEPPGIDHNRVTSKTDEASKKHFIEIIAWGRLYEILLKETPAGNFESIISAELIKMPNWLLDFCLAKFSMQLLGIEHEPSETIEAVKADLDAWLFLPQGVPQRCDNKTDQSDFRMSLEESRRALEIASKPKEEWTRHERRFHREMTARQLLAKGWPRALVYRLYPFSKGSTYRSRSDRAKRYSDP